MMIGLWISTISFSQKNEYQYIGLRFGASHGFSGTPDFNPMKYLITPSGEMQVTPVSGYKGYTPGFVADLYYHFDFTTDNAGIFIGIEYIYDGISSKYETMLPEDQSVGIYTMTETFRMHKVGVPIAFKYGPKIYDSQGYVFGGFQFNYIVSMSSEQSYSWKPTPSAIKLESEEYNKTALNLFIGLNYNAFNIQFDYYPSTPFNRAFDKDGSKIYAGMVEQTFTIKTSINVAHGWLSDQSFWWKKKLRKFPIWK